jgi:outer membrane receptor protein involved in Fe transport
VPEFGYAWEDTWSSLCLFSLSADGGKELTPDGYDKMLGKCESQANFSPPSSLFPLDHDQRNTLNVGGDVALPWRSYASTNVYYGSGFSNAFPGQPYPGDKLPQHTTFGLSISKDFGERFSASLNALNVANRRVELDNSQTFGGFHWNYPREIYAEFRYRFHY